MTLWLGMMKIAEAAGLVTMLGRALRPVLRWMFPEVPAEHPAAGAIVVAIAANMLGLNNAATPLGIKAMEDLQELNGDKETATNPMVTFMAMTTSGVQLIPSTMIGAAGGGGVDQSHGDHRAGPGGDVHRHGRRRRRREAAAAVLSDASGRRPRRRAPSDSRRARRHLDLGRAGHARRHRHSPA